MADRRLRQVPKAALRLMKKVWGMTVSVAHTRRPRILRLETSKPRGSKVGDVGW